MIGDFRPDGGGPRYFGLYPALVTDIVDPDELGRVEVELPWLGGGDAAEVRSWATLVTPYADAGQGLQCVPEVGSQVVVGFEAGDPRRPYVVGACWNGAEAMPERPEKANDLRLIHTRAGSRLEFDDASGAAVVTLKTAGGHKLVLDEGGSSVTLEHANGSVITLDPKGRIEIRANATVEVTASALNVHAPTAVFDGMVSCKTLIASSSVVSPSYTPGAGNVW